MQSIFGRWIRRPTRDVHIDTATVDSIRTEAPGHWAMLASSTRRSATQLRRFGWLILGTGVIHVVVELWIANGDVGRHVPGWSYVMSGFWSGHFVGIGLGMLIASRYRWLLAMLKGEVGLRRS